jgi:flagellar basal body rod protein FlgB
MKHLFIACALLLTSAFSYAQTAEEIIKKAYEASSQNLANLFNPNYKFKGWNDVL